MPIGHLGLNVPDLDVARAYYEQLLPALEFELFVSDADQFAYRPAGGKPGTYLFVYRAADARAYSQHATGLQHMAFIVRTRSDVDRICDLARRLGSEIVHEPRIFPSTRRPTTRPSGWIPTASCSKPFATTDPPPSFAFDRSRRRRPSPRPIRTSR
jgi:catechol 2,3-dioxygenase-like lactoylglutathione lyase family enzyme